MVHTKLDLRIRATATSFHPLESSINGRFETNPHIAPGNPFFPSKVIGINCSRWAIKMAMTFTDIFFEQLGVKASYEGLL